MDNLAANGQIDLGNPSCAPTISIRAEPVFRRALDIARRAKVRRIEARAQGVAGIAARKTIDPAKRSRSSRPR